ncbi:U-box domain-containing protein 15 [Linum perenne]
MDEEENGGTSSGEEEIESTSPQGANDVVDSILRVIESVARLGGYRGTHRKECIALVRRMKTFLPFLEEVRDLDTPIPDHGIECLKNLKATFVMAKNLLKTCNEGSKIYLAAEREAVTARFRAVHEKLFNVVESIPYEELGISDEIREQVDLMRKQLKRFNRHSDSQDMELAMDLMFVLSKQDDQSNSDSAIIERIARKLDLDDVENVNNETIAVRNLVRERGGTSHDDTLQHIVDMLNKMRKIVGLEESCDLHNCQATKSLAKSPSLIIPHEFLCPITLEIMVDPVIIASGQTYERESIQKWLDANHMTCPKTRQTLDNPSIAPNYALKNIIIQWCDKHKFKLPKKETTDPSAKSSEQCRGIDQVSILVEELSSSNLDVQRRAVKEIRMLSKESPENRVSIADSGGISPIVDLLQYPDSKIQEHAVTALLNLSLDKTNKRAITEAGAIPAIVDVLQNGCREAKENSAAALFSLSMLDENKVTIGLSDGIPPLVDLLQHGTMRGKKDALTALFNLCLNDSNKEKAIETGIVNPLFNLLKNRNLNMIDETLSIFLLLASHPEGRNAVGQLPFVEKLVEFMKDGTPKNKECATSVLLELGSGNSNYILMALQFGVYEHLVEMSETGTDRGKRKANALLHLITKTEQL